MLNVNKKLKVPSPKKLWICEDKKVDITEVRLIFKIKKTYLKAEYCFKVTKLVLHKLPGRIIAEIFKYFVFIPISFYYMFFYTNIITH